MQRIDHPTAQATATIGNEDQESKQACLRYNADLFKRINEHILSQYELTQNQSATLKSLIEVISRRLGEELIHLSIDAGINRLVQLMENHLSTDLSSLDSNIQQWIAEYRQIEMKATEVHQRIVAAHGDNIIRCLQRNPSQAIRVFGDDLDFTTILTGYISDPYNHSIEFKSNRHYILPPTAVDISTVESAGHNPVTYLQDRITKVISRCPNASNVRLRIPLNLSQNHWQLLKVTLNQGKVTSAKIIDSLSSANNASAFDNVKIALQHVNRSRSVPLKLIATGEQSNGHSCMDFVIRTILRSSDTLELKQSPLLRELKASNNAHNMRSIIIELLLNNAPALKSSPSATYTKAAKLINECNKIPELNCDLASILPALSEEEKESYIESHNHLIIDYVAALDHLSQRLQLKLLHSRIDTESNLVNVEELKQINRKLAAVVWLDYKATLSIINELSSYLKHQRKLQFQQVKSLQKAITKTSTLVHVGVLIQRELDRVNNSVNSPFIEDSLFLRNTFSLGYKHTLKKCLKFIKERHINIELLEQSYTLESRYYHGNKP